MSARISGGVGKFSYTGTRKDDRNDLIPHELRRELRGMYVVASWVNHADSGDKIRSMHMSEGKDKVLSAIA